MPQFLIIRGKDFVHLGIEWTGFQLADVPTAGGRPHLVAISDQAQVTLTFPPQVLSERPVTPSGPRSPTRRSSTSRIRFSVPQGTTMELHAEGILKALSNPAVRIVSGDPLIGEATAIEIPWRLIVSVTGLNGDAAVSQHSALPLTSDRHVTGLWHLRMRAGEGNAEDGMLALLPLRAEVSGESPDRPPFSVLLDVHRNRIIEEFRRPTGSSARRPPHARRLELSSLGGSLSTTGKWPTFEWDHEVVMGRDQYVRVLTTGMLYPFGHRAQVLEVTERAVNFWQVQRPPQPVPEWRCPDPDHTDTFPEDFNPVFCPICGRLLRPITPPEPPPFPSSEFHGVAGLERKIQLVITEPLQSVHPTRDFPFSEIEILARTFDGIETSSAPFFVPRLFGEWLRFPVRCKGTQGDVFFDVPMVFIRNFSRDDLTRIEQLWSPHSTIKVPGVAIDLINSRVRRSESDVHEVHSLTMAIEASADGFRPKLTQFTVELPAVRMLRRKNDLLTLAYRQEFLDQGESEDVALKIIEPLKIDFSESPNLSGGLIVPNYTTDVISRTLGPVPNSALTGTAEQFANIFKETTLLGVSLGSLIKVDTLPAPPTITPVPGNPPGAKMEWENLRLQSHAPFQTRGDTKANLTVKRTKEQTEIRCEIESFNFVLPLSGAPLVTLKFDSVVFTQSGGKAPNLEIKGLSIEFGGALQIVKTLTDKLTLLLGGKGPTIHATSLGITAGYTLTIPDVSAGMFVMRNVAVNFGVNVPFTRNPVTVYLGFARRDNPFNLSVSMFGGGGYIEVQMGAEGLSGLEVSMEFGAVVDVNFVIVRAEVHALAGVRSIFSGGSITIGAFIRIGGSVEILGLVSVSVELVVALMYEGPSLPEHPRRNRLIGRATLVIEVDLTLFSESVTLDSGTWILEGPPIFRTVQSEIGGSTQITDFDPNLRGLMIYLQSFAP